MTRTRFSGCAFFLALAVTTVGCGKGDTSSAEEKSPKESPKEVKLVVLDLSKVSADHPWTIEAPAEAKAKDGVLGIEISNGSIYQIEFSDAKDIVSLKKEIEKNPLNQLKKIHVESKDVLLYESQIKGQPNTEFHFLANVKVGDKTVGAEDIKGGTYTKAQVELMLKSFQTLKAKK